MACIFTKIGLVSRNAWFCQARTCQNAIRFESTASKKGSDKKEVVISQEDSSINRPTFRIHWKRLKRTYMYFLKYLEIYKNFFKNDKHDGRLRISKHDQIVYHFRRPEDLEYWYIMTDEDGGGHSWAELKQSPNEMTMLFRGYLNQKPPTAFLEQAPDINVERSFTGTAYIETKPFYVSTYKTANS